MAEQVLRDRYGHIIGRITQRSGQFEIRDSYGHLKGRYDPKTDTTRDAYGHLVGKGNLLTSLL